MNRSVISTLSEGWFKKIEKEPTRGEEPPDIDNRIPNILDNTKQSTLNIQDKLSNKFTQIKNKINRYT